MVIILSHQLIKIQQYYFGLLLKKYFNDAKKWIKKPFDVECFPYTESVEIEWYFILTEEQFLIWVLKYLKDLYED